MTWIYIKNFLYVYCKFANAYTFEICIFRLVSQLEELATLAN